MRYSLLCKWHWTDFTYCLDCRTFLTSAATLMIKQTETGRTKHKVMWKLFVLLIWIQWTWKACESEQILILLFIQMMATEDRKAITIKLQKTWSLDREWTACVQQMALFNLLSFLVSKRAKKLFSVLEVFGPLNPSQCYTTDMSLNRAHVDIVPPRDFAVHHCCA